MPFSAGPNIAARPNLVFEYDTGDVQNSYKGEPTTNLVPSPYAYSLYAYASGPVDTTVLNETGNTITAKRYTVTQAVNVARAAIFPVTTTNTNYTFSFKWKYNGSTTATPSFTVSAAKGNPETANNSFNSQSTTTTAIGNGWYLTVYTFNFSSNPTSGCILTFGLNTGGTASYVGETYDIYQAQFELKDHKTQYVLGTRSNTQGLLDVSGQNNTINLASVSFTSAAQPTFDGTDDYISVDNSNSLQVGDTFTISAWVYPTNLNARYGVFSTRRFNTTGCWQFEVGTASGGTNRIAVTGIGTWIFETSNNVISPNVWTNICFVKPGNSTQGGSLYVNGVSVPPLNTTAYSILNNSDIKVIGSGTNLGQFFPGNIANVTLYNFPLSAQEVLRNYNQLKGRFNLI